MKIKYLVFSDVHLGHAKTPSEHIISNLCRELLSNDKKDCDVFFCAGDFFDRLLDFNEDDVRCILVFINQLLTFCSDNQIKLRVLEGTSSHDWHQSRVFIQMNSMLPSPCDLRYVECLSVEHFVEYDMDVLYIPDNWISSTAQLRREVDAELQANKINKVDLAIMHGNFTYQTDGGGNTSYSFEEAYFLNLVKHYIHIGHYHTHTHYERIIAEGSFDRLKHGEEEKKGYVVASIDTGTNFHNWAFCSNDNAYIYKTVKVWPNMDLPRLDKIMSKIPKNSHVCLKIPPSHAFNVMMDQLKIRYVDCYLTKTSSEKSEEKVVAYINNDSVEDMSQFVLNEANLTSRLRDQIADKDYDFAPTHWNLFHNYMKEFT